MDPARLSITHTADSSMKNVICEAGEQRSVKMPQPVVQLIRH